MKFDEITGKKFAIDNCYDLVFVGRAQKLQILLFRFVIKLQASTGNYPGQVQLLLSEIVAEKIGKLKKWKAEKQANTSLMPFGTWPGKSDRKRRHRQKGIVITKLKLRQLHDGLSKINEWMLWHRQIDRAYGTQATDRPWGIGGRIHWVRVCGHNALVLPMSSCRLCGSVALTDTDAGIGNSSNVSRPRPHHRHRTGSNHQVPSGSASSIRQRPSPSAGNSQQAASAMRQMAGGCSWWLMPRPLLIEICCIMLWVAPCSGCLATSLHDATALDCQQNCFAVSSLGFLLPLS